MHAPSGLVLDAVPPAAFEPSLGPFGDAGIDRAVARGWDLLGTVPVPLRHRVRDGVAELVTGHHSAGGSPLQCCFPLGQGGHSPFDRLRFIRTLDDFPAMLVSCEHGNAFSRRFYHQHVAGGAFAACQPAPAAPVFADAGLIDRDGQIGVFAVAPFVLLVDRERLDGRPVPRRWADLMDPLYRDLVVFSGWRREGERRYRQVNTFLLLFIALRFGFDGLARMLRNVPALLHSAQMPRRAGTAASPGGIYVLPWSLADLCPRRTTTEVVWPEEGALAYPLWLTVKTAHAARLDVLLRHFYGPELADYLDHNRYPALCPGRRPAVPPGARMTWPGWETIRDPATARTIKLVRDCFRERETGCARDHGGRPALGGQDLGGGQDRPGADRRRDEGRCGQVRRTVYLRRCGLRPRRPAGSRRSLR